MYYQLSGVKLEPRRGWSLHLSLTGCSLQKQPHTCIYMLHFYGVSRFSSAGRGHKQLSQSYIKELTIF